MAIFSRVHATLYVTMLVRWLVGWSVGRSVVIELKSGKTRISAPAHPSATDGRVSGLVFVLSLIFFLFFSLSFFSLANNQSSFYYNIYLKTDINPS